jgi:hypothetical protein
VLSQLSANGRTYGIDIVIAIGLLRWGLCLQREQVQLYLKRREINISTGTISNLSFDFLLLIKQIHENQCDKLKETFSSNNGMIIHVDATDEKGGNAVFLIKEENTEITLFAESIVSEKEEYIIPIFQRFKATFGNPIAVIRDMGAAMISSCDKEFPDIPQQICHYHFIRALGMKIFDDIYSEFRSALIKSEMGKDLHYIRKTIKQKLKGSDVILKERHALYWLHLVIDHMLYPIKQNKNYPFRLPYKEFYDRITEISSIFLQNDLNNCGSIIKIHQLSSLRKHVLDIIKDKKIQELSNTIDQLWDWYIKLRETMGLMRNTLNECRTLSQEEVETMKRGLNKELSKIKKSGKKLGGLFAQKSDMIDNYFQTKWGELFIDLRDRKGNYVPIHRDNNINEQAHRWVRMRIRRRTGRNRTQTEMYQLGALLAIFSNLYIEQYRDIICNGIENLAEEFSTLDWGRLFIERRKLFLQNDGLSIPVKDEVREELLYDYIENVINQSSTLDGYLNKWLIKMHRYIECWNIDFAEEEISLKLM